MGFFGTYLFDGQRWMPHEPDKLPTVPELWLLVDVHDSDIATIAYRPTGSGSGVADWSSGGYPYRGGADDAEYGAKAAELVT